MDWNRLQQLLRQGASPSERDVHGWCAIHYASEEGHVQVFLLRWLAEPHVLCPQAIRQLIRAGASVHERTPVSSPLPPAHPMPPQHAHLVELGQFGSTALHCAANNGHLEAVRELLWTGGSQGRFVGSHQGACCGGCHGGSLCCVMGRPALVPAMGRGPLRWGMPCGIEGLALGP